jgi:hypothetical protein
MPRTHKERRELIKQLASKRHTTREIITGGIGRVSEEFWKLPRPKDSEGLLLKALLKGSQRRPLAVLEVLG